MSGIYGMVRLDAAPVTSAMLAPMVEAMAFRGRDGHGQWIGEAAGLGHFMLHVVPESLHERMPANIQVAPHLIITADARIDNRGEIFDALGVPASGRTKTPDSSLILLAYERWGGSCAQRLLGDFAFAILNTRDRTLFCARDPLGCRPFVYSFDGTRLIFASDIKGVVACDESPRLNEPLLAAHLQMKTYHAQKRQTFFENVVKLPPGHTLTLSGTRVQVSRYWSPEDAPMLNRASQADYIEELRHLFRQAVECRLRSVFPVGAHLSGGIDSSSISVAGAQILRGRGRGLATFSWSPPKSAEALQRGNEYSRIEAVCSQEDLQCEYLPATAESLIDVFQRDFTVEPMAMMARETNVQVRAGARGLRVLLSGWGGDAAITSRVNIERTGLRAALLSRLPDSLYSRLVTDPFMTHASPCVRSEFAERYRREVKELQGPAMRRLPGIRANILRLLDMGHLSLRMEDWATSGAASGLVYRYPMLDRRIVEFALGAATSVCRRSLFLQAMEDLLPSPGDWEAKVEAATFAALEKEHLIAHSKWWKHLASQGSNIRASRFVDPQLIENAVQNAVRSGKLQALQGVKEAFGCYAIRPR